MKTLGVMEAASTFKARFPSRKVEWMTDLDGVWYVCAPDNDPDEGMMNPYFTVDSRTGKVGEFYLTQNLALFNRIIEKVQLEHRNRPR